MYDYLLYATCCLMGSFIASLVANILLERNYWTLARRIKSLENHLAGEAGYASKGNKQTRLNEALIRLKPILDGQGTIGEKINKALPLIAEYPDVAADILKIAQKYLPETDETR